jgi:hypothetical protein
MKKIIVALGFTVLVLSMCAAVFAEETAVSAESKDQAVLGAAQTWLELVDKAEYAKSWDTASAYFKTMITQQQWVAQIEPVRKSLGDLISRDLKEHKYESTLPGAPDAEYCVLIFATSFSLKAQAVETVTMMKDKDGQWRAAGYFIR